MSEKDTSIVIPVQGLSAGKHEYGFSVGFGFIEQFGNSTITDCDCSVRVELDKSSTFLGARCVVEGSVAVECDRCLERLDIPVSFDHKLTVKFSGAGQEPDDDVAFIEEGACELDLSQFVYDYICLSVPIVKVHPAGGCNPEMVARLDEMQRTGACPSAAESPFSALKDLLESKN